MKILFTNTGSWGTGSFFAIDSLAKGYLQKGHQVQIFFPDAGLSSVENDTYYNNNKLYEIWKYPIKKNDIELKNFPLMIPDPNVRSPNGVTFKQLSKNELDLYLGEFKKRIQNVVEKFKPNIIDSQHAWAMAYVLAKLNYPYVISAHNSDQIAFEYDERMRSFAEYAAKNAKCIFALTAPNKEKIIKLYGVEENKVIIVLTFKRG